MSTRKHILPLRWRAYMRHPRVRGLVITGFWSVVVFYFVFGALILATRWYLLPQVERFRGDIADILSASLQSRVEIGAIEPRWDTFWPHLTLKNVTIRKNAERDADAEVLNLPLVDASLYWNSIFGEPVFRRLTVSGAELTVRRLSDTAFDIAGFEFSTVPAAEPAAGGQQPADRRFAGWLLKQGRIDIVDSSVRYTDLTKPETGEVRLTEIDLSFVHNVTDYGFGLQAVVADGSRNTIDLRGRFSTPLFESDDWRGWSGELYLDASRINIAELLVHSPASSVVKSGSGSTRTWATFANARIKSITSNLFLRNVELQLADSVKPLKLERAAGRLTETLSGDTLSVHLKNVRARDEHGREWEPFEASAQMSLSGHAASGNVALSVVDLALLRDLLESVPLPKSVQEWLSAGSPSGHIRNLVLSWRGALRNPDGWSVKADFDRVSAKPHNHTANGRTVSIPGFTGLSGSVMTTPESARVELASQSASVSIPKIFKEETMQFDALKGTVDWHAASAEGPMRLTFTDISVENADIAAAARGTWTATGGAGTMNVTGEIFRASVPAAWKYMPKVVGEGTQNWLEAGLVAGTGSDGRFEIIGELARFPWTKDNRDKEHFLVDLKLTNAAIDYVPSGKKDAHGRFERAAVWPLLTDIDGRLTFEAGEMRVTADSARTTGAVVGPATAVIPNLAAGKNTMLNVRGEASGNLQEMLGYLNASPVGKWLGNAFAKTKATGPGSLTLSLSIPLLHAHDTRVAGTLKLAGNSIDMGKPVPPLTDVEGSVEFTERGATARRLVARPFGHGDAVANITTTDDGAFTITASGTADVRDLTYFTEEPAFAEVMRRVSGSAPFVTTVSIQPGRGVSVTAQSSLKGVTSTMPAPLNKTADESWPLDVVFSPVEINRNKGVLVRVGSGERFDVMLQIPDAGSQLKPLGTIAVGRRAGLPGDGLEVLVQAERLSVPAWTEPVKKIIAAVRSDAIRADAPSAHAPSLRRVQVSTKEMQTRDSVVRNLDLTLTHSEDSQWSANIRSDKIAGRLDWQSFRGKRSDRLTLDLERLYINKSTNEAARRFLEGDAAPGQPTDGGKPRRSVRAGALPEVEARIADMRYEDKHLGRVTLSAAAVREQNHERLDITKLEMTSPAATLTGTGRWSHPLDAAASEPGRTEMDFKLQLADAGALLAQLGFPGVIDATQGSASAKLSFEGSPWEPDAATLAGETTINMRNGSLVQVETGAGGALLNLLSFQSLLKRLRLDFSDLAQDGFFFDTAAGSSVIDQGVLSTDNFKIVGTHGTVLLTGSADLAKRTLDGRVVVLPDINAGNASIALSFLNPAVGIGTFLAQLVLRDPLSRLFKIEYDISGTLDEPRIEKAGASKPDAETPAAAP